jgi:tRNA nucleotidyltransferase (CCA-adding enzyme)
MKIYLVGGAVRDELMGLPIIERDWVVIEGSPEHLLAEGFESVGKHFPVFIHPETGEEYALARTERKVGGGYQGFEFDTSNHITLEEDLKRRDLTINAMAKTEEGKIIDPYGGQADLKNKILRHVSEAFVEDPVRVLRVARFAARFAKMGFTIAPETQTLMQNMVDQGECDHLVPERIWKEMERALSEDSPVSFIRVLRQCGALKRLLPEIDKLYGVPQSPTSHPEIDTGIHTELVLEQAARLSRDPKVRFAALMHDLGKGLTDPALWPKHKNHEITGEAPLKSLCQRLKVPNDYQSLAHIVMRYHKDYYDLPVADPEHILQLLEHIDAIRRPERCFEFMAACTADYCGRPGYENKTHPSQDLIKSAFQAAVSVDVKEVIAGLGVADGEAIKKAIREARRDAIAKNT